ncbi:MAG: ankyrin repeat domain-containing protein [Dissulfurispiraceae bacterium]
MINKIEIKNIVSKSNKKKRIHIDTTGNNPNLSSNLDLLDAVENNDCAEILRLIKCGADVNTKNEYGETPLHTACVRGYFEVAQTLMIAGADVNTPNCIGSAPLHEASEWGHFGIAQVLIEAGADLNAKDIYNWAPLHYATAMNHLNIKWALIKAGSDLNAIP